MDNILTLYRIILTNTNDSWHENNGPTTEWGEWMPDKPVDKYVVKKVCNGIKFHKIRYEWVDEFLYFGEDWACPDCNKVTLYLFKKADALRKQSENKVSLPYFNYLSDLECKLLLETALCVHKRVLNNYTWVLKDERVNWPLLF